MKTFVSVLLMIGLAGCAMAAPVPAPPPAPGNVGGILHSSLVLGQPRRLPDAEAGAATATASEASPAGDLARVEAVPESDAERYEELIRAQMDRHGAIDPRNRGITARNL